MSLQENYKRLQVPNTLRHEFYEMDEQSYRRNQMLTQDKALRAGRKNRYCDILPFDTSLVELRGGSGYVNASLVKGPEPFSFNSYICAQEPMNHTKADFWEMIWEQGVRVIVMMNSTRENQAWDGPHARPYFPTGEEGYTELVLGSLRMSLDPEQRVTRGPVITERKLLVERKGSISGRVKEVRHVTHIHFRAWHDLSTPRVSEFLMLRERVKGAVEEAGPRDQGAMKPSIPVIHCLGGIGRTGTYVTVDIILDMIRDHKTRNIDLRSILLHLRQQRQFFVQTQEQYLFCYEAILEGSKDYEVSPDGIRVAIDNN